MRRVSCPSSHAQKITQISIKVQTNIILSNQLLRQVLFVVRAGNSNMAKTQSE